MQRRNLIMWCTVAKWASAIAVTTLLVSNKPAVAASDSTGVAVVARLYRDFGWQAFAIQHEVFGEGVTHQGKEVLGRYFSRDLGRLLVEDAACQKRERGICQLDFDILFNAQDPVVTDLELTVLAPGKVLVRFKNPMSREVFAIEYRLARAAGRWRIADVVYGQQDGRSLKRTLQGR